MWWRPAQRFPRRLPATDKQLERMVWFPSYRAPAVGEVLQPTRPDSSESLTVEALLERWSAEDLIRKHGEIVACSLSGRSFIAGGSELLARTAICSVRLVAVLPYLDELADCPHLAAIMALNLNGNRIGTAGLRLLLASPYLSSLRELQLEHNSLDDAAAELLLSADLPRLERLILTRTEFSDSKWLALSARFGTITR